VSSSTDLVPVADQGGRLIYGAPDQFDVILGVVGIESVPIPDILVVHIGVVIPVPEPAFPEPCIDTAATGDRGYRRWR